MLDEINTLTDNFTKKLYKSIKPGLACRARGKKEFLAWRKTLKAKVKELLGEMPQPAALKPKFCGKEEKGGFVREKWVIQTEKDCFMPLYLLIPRGHEGEEAILCCHGHTDMAQEYGKDSVAGLTLNLPDRKACIDRYNYNYAEQMAEKGFVTIAPDWRSFGERVAYTNSFAPGHQCDGHFMQYLVLGRTLLGANVFDGRRALDFLGTRKEVDKDRIGCMGLSFGGTMTTYITLLDDRIKAADISGYATTTEHYVVNRSFTCGSQLVPFLYKYADVGDVIGAIAPRPLLVESGNNDTIFFLDPAKKAHQIIRKAYQAAGASQDLWIEIFAGEHRFSGGKAFEFFEKYL